MDRKPVIGILGGIGSGKSTVSEIFAQLGCGIVDADAAGHTVLQQREVVQEIVDQFGNKCLNTDGQIDRKVLAEVCFSNAVNLRVLNGIVHPEILTICRDQMNAYQQDPGIAAIVLDLPLLMEVGWDQKCDFMVFVDCPEAVRAARFNEKGQFDKKEQKKREIFQISLDKKRTIADYTIDNNSSVSDLGKQVEKVFSAIVSRR